MHRPKRQVADRGNAPEFIATRLCHYEQIDGIARLVFSTPSLKLPGDPPGVDDVITLVLIMPISEPAHMARVLSAYGQPAAAATVDVDTLPLTQH